MEREKGIEPSTSCLEGRRSTTELLPLARTERVYCVTGPRAINLNAIAASDDQTRQLLQICHLGGLKNFANPYHA